MIGCRGMLHDPDVYPHPEVFCPERFLSEDGTINAVIRDGVMAAVFGFGRRYAASHAAIRKLILFPHRVCPGRYFALEVLPILMASILHVFNLSADVDALGNPVKVSTDTEGSFVMCVMICRQHLNFCSTF